MEIQQRNNIMKIAIAVLAILLGISVIALVSLLLYNHFADASPATVSVPNNIIASGEENNPQEPSDDGLNLAAQNAAAPAEGAGGTVSGETKAQMLELYKKHAEDNAPFASENLLPGDTVTQYYAVKAHHSKDVTLFFRPDVTEETKNLGNVLHIQVTNLQTGSVLCDGMFAEVDGREISEVLTANADNESTAYYAVTVSIDTSVGNEYQAARLLADFHWYAAEEDRLTNPPQTGDNFMVLLWIVIAVSAALLILLVLLYKRRKEDGSNAR